MMKGIKVIFAIFFLGILVSSCSSKQKYSDFQIKIKELKIKNLALENKVKEYTNCIVIKPNEVKDYFIPVSFGPSKVNVNEKAIFETVLVCKKLPKNIQVEWTCNPEPQYLEKVDLRNYVKNSFESKRKVNFNGNYVITFPNKTKSVFEWSRSYEVK